MKKFSHFLIMLLVVALAITMMPVSTQAATAKKSTVMKKADAVTKDLTKYANYRGWEVSARVTKKSGKQIKKSVKAQTASGTYFKYTQVTKKSEKKYKTYFVSKGRKFKLSEVKSGIRRYSSAKTVKSFLKARAQKSAKSLASYAKARGWNTSTKIAASGSKKATATVAFSNRQYEFSATMAVKRSKTPKTTYARQGKKSTAKNIKAWLDQYKDATSGTTPGATDAPGTTDSPDDKPGTNTSAVTDADVIAMVTANTDVIVTTAKAKDWTVTETGRGTMEVKLHLENSEYQFDAAIKGANQGGKAVISYTLMNVGSSQEEIISWLTKFQAAPLPSNATTAPTTDPSATPSGSPNPSESPKPSETPAPKPISSEDLKKAAADAMNELKIASSTNEWSYTELVNTGDKIQVSFENSQWEFKVTVEAKAEDGKIKLVYTLAGDSSGEVEKETILNWFTTYKAAPKATATPKPTDTPSPSSSQTPGTSATPPVATKTPEPGNTQPSSTTTPPTTTQQPPSSTTDLTVVAKRAMTELEIEGALKNWAFKRITEDRTKIWNYFYNSTYGFYVSTEAKSEDGTVVLAYTVKATADDKQAILGNSSEELIKWFATYRTAAAKEEPDNVATADRMETEFTTDIPLMPCRLALDNTANGAVVGPNDAQPIKPTK